MTKEEYLKVFEQDLFANKEQITRILGSFLKKKIWRTFIVGFILLILSIVADVLFYMDGNELFCGIYAVFILIFFSTIVMVLFQFNKQRKQLNTNYSEFVRETVETHSFTLSQTKLLREDAEVYVVEMFVKASKNRLMKKIITIPKETYLMKENSVNETLEFYLSPAFYKSLWSKVQFVMISYRYKENGELFMLEEEEK